MRTRGHLSIALRKVFSCVPGRSLFSLTDLDLLLPAHIARLVSVSPYSVQSEARSAVPVLSSSASPLCSHPSWWYPQREVGTDRAYSSSASPRAHTTRRFEAGGSSSVAPTSAVSGSRCYPDEDPSWATVNATPSRIAVFVDRRGYKSRLVRALRWYNVAPSPCAPVIDSSRFSYSLSVVEESQDGVWISPAGLPWG